jgi:hypothetical protein
MPRNNNKRTNKNKVGFGAAESKIEKDKLSETAENRPIVYVKEKISFNDLIRCNKFSWFILTSHFKSQHKVS